MPPILCSNCRSPIEENDPAQRVNRIRSQVRRSFWLSSTALILSVACMVISWYFSPSSAKPLVYESTGPGTFIYQSSNFRVLVYKEQDGFRKELRPLCGSIQPVPMDVTLVNVTYHWHPYTFTGDLLETQCFSIDKVQMK